jgi:hypothetical protein
MPWKSKTMEDPATSEWPVESLQDGGNSSDTKTQSSPMRKER